jgi:hypothetical protein
MEQRAENPFSLRWSVAVGGYYWQEDRLYPDPRRGWRNYSIPAKPIAGRKTLGFRDLANTSPTPERIAEFAKVYGALRDEASTLEEWQRAIKTMWTLSKFRDAIWYKNVDQIKQVVEMRTTRRADGRMGRWVHYNFHTLNSMPGAGTILAADSMRETGLPLRVLWNDYLKAASECLRSEVNKQLEKYAVVPHIRWANGKQYIDFMPTSLLAALWLQFAQNITGRSAALPCAGPGCKQHVYIGVAGPGKTKAKSAQALTCSDRCRKTYSREIERKAKEVMREHPRMSDAEMLKLFIKEGIAGDPWRGEKWVHNLRHGIKRKRKASPAR